MDSPEIGLPMPMGHAFPSLCPTIQPLERKSEEQRKGPPHGLPALTWANHAPRLDRWTGALSLCPASGCGVQPPGRRLGHVGRSRPGLGQGGCLEGGSGRGVYAGPSMRRARWVEEIDTRSKCLCYMGLCARAKMAEHLARHRKPLHIKGLRRCEMLSHPEKLSGLGVC